MRSEMKSIMFNGSLVGEEGCWVQLYKKGALGFTVFVKLRVITKEQVCNYPF